MRSLVFIGLVFVGLPSPAAWGQNASEVVADLNDSSRSLSKLKSSYASARRRFQERLAQVKTEQERSAVADDMQRQQQLYSKQFLELAEQTQDPEIGFAALAWVVENDFRGSLETRSALEELAQNHLQNDELTAVCRQLAEGLPLPEIESFLVAAGESDNREVKGIALYSRALLLRRRAEIVSLLKLPEDSAQRVAAEKVLGAEVARQLAVLEPQKLNLQSERLLQEVADAFDDLPAHRGSLADVAKADLYEARNLNVGQTAPDIVGADLDGRELKLSDYRGKVVVLSFWGSWCPHCQEILPQERSLVTHLKDRPFALLGVNNDEDRELAAKFAEKEQMTWPSWWDGDPKTGKIATQWNVTEWPTIYVIDAAGVIRHKSEGVSRGGLAAGVAPTIDELMPDSNSQGPRLRTTLFLVGGTICLLLVAVRAWMNRTPGAARL